MAISIIHTRLVPVKEPPDNPRMTDDATIQTEFQRRLAGGLADRLRTIAEDAIALRMTPQAFAERTSAMWDVAVAHGVALDVLRRLTHAEAEVGA